MSPPNRAVVHRFAVATAAVAGAFVLLVAGVLCYLHVTATTNDPWKSPQLLELKEQMRAAPKDEAIKARIRELDFQFRRHYVQHLRLGALGGWMLLGGAVVLVVALQTAAEMRQRLPAPQPDPHAATAAARRAAQSRRAVAGAGLATGVAMLLIAAGVRSHFSDRAAQAAGAAAGAAPAVEPLPPPAEFARNWPRFRGPDGGGVAAGPDAPLHWDAATGAGVAWKAVVPAPGFNSPIVWGERVFVSGATKEKREVFCYDAGSGKLLWQCGIPLPKLAPGEALDLAEDTGYAPSTLATDGRHVYAIFPHGDLTAITLAGRIAWTRHLGLPRNPYGHAASLAVWQGRVFVQFDQGEVDSGRSRLLAFDGASGRPVWEKPRPVGSSWSTPIVVEAGGRTQVVTLGDPFIISYAFADGAELWRVKGLEGEIAPSPIFAGGLVLAVNPWKDLLAVRPDGTGDVTGTHVAWQTEESVPDTSSPVSDGTWAYVVNTGGEVYCFAVKDGAKVWKKDLETGAHASPLIIGRRLYLTFTNGLTVVAEGGAEFKELARNQLGEKIFASPAYAAGRLYFRGAQHLFCLAEGKAPVPSTP